MYSLFDFDQFWPVTYSILDLKNVCIRLLSLSVQFKMCTPPHVIANIVFLRDRGMSARMVANDVNVSKSSVCRLYKRYQETGSFERRPGTGLSRKTTARDDRFILMTSLRDRTLSSIQISNEIQRVRDVAVSHRTVRRRLAEKNVTPKRAATGPKLTTQHRQARLRFALEHLARTDDQWSCVLFSDESRANLYANDRRTRVYRRPGERFAPCCIKETVAFGGGSCMFWGGISMNANTDLVIINCGGVGGI